MVNIINRMFQITAMVLLSISLINCGGGGTPPLGTGTQTPARVALMSPSPASINLFGLKMAFSPDGNTIVISESSGDPASVIDAGTAQVFTKSNGTWTQTQTLTAQTPTRGTAFGWSVAISQDGLMLAVGGYTTNAVDLYTKSSANWVYSQTILPNDTTALSFGISVAFHPNSSLLAIGDFQASPNGVNVAGAVQLFTKSGTTWVFAQQLTAPLPASTNNFGTGVIFSPDGSTLAVSEMYGDPSTAIDAGTVHLFTSNGGRWTSKQSLISNVPTTNFVFGGDLELNAVHFSPDSNTLAIGEYVGNNVQLFNRAGTNWVRGPVLTVANALGQFGVGVSFSASGNTLAIGEHYGTSNGIGGAGNVYLFNKSGTNWILDKTVSALNPTLNNYFGYSVFFSPIGNELAIFEHYGDTSSAVDAGVVSIIDISQLP